MRKKKAMEVGDIYYNPMAKDLWILRKDIYEDEDEESWVLSLVHSDYIEKYEYVKGFIYVGNIYELVINNINDGKVGKM